MNQVTWVEHTTCRNAAVPSMYRSAAASGLAFGARRWVAALQLQCERMVFSVATNIPARDSSGKRKDPVAKIVQQWSMGDGRQPT